MQDQCDPTDIAAEARFSVIVPMRSAVDDWPALIERFEPLKPRMAELIVVLDGVRQAPPPDAPPNLVVISTPVRAGPAGARNLGAERAGEALLAFTDDDCRPESGWLDAMADALSPHVAATGGVRIPRSGWLGDAISMLGFPAGGNLGFGKVWTVHPDNTTEHLSTCNFAIRRDAFVELGGFDASFPYPGGEDNEFAARLRRNGPAIAFAPEAIVNHEARDSYTELVTWQFRRGRGQYHLVRKIGRLGEFARPRLRSVSQIMRATWGRTHFVIMPALIIMVFAAQTTGYVYEFFHAAYRRR